MKPVVWPLWQREEQTAAAWLDEESEVVPLSEQVEPIAGFKAVLSH